MAILQVPATYSTIALALAAASSSDTIELTDNVSEAVNLTQQIAGFRSEVGQKYTWDNAAGQYCLRLAVPSDTNGTISIERIAFSTSSFNGIQMSAIPAETLFDFEQCDFSGGAFSQGTINISLTDSVVVSSGKGALFNRCTVTGASTAVKVNYRGDVGRLDETVRFENCILKDPTSVIEMALALAAGTDNPVMIRNCVVYCSSGSALRVPSSNYISMENTSVYGATADFLSFFGIGDISNVVNCAFSETLQAGVGANNIGEVDQTTAGLNFTDGPNGDFTTPDGSVLINVGLANSLTTDYTGNPRPIATVDIGAYEHQSTVDELLSGLVNTSLRIPQNLTVKTTGETASLILSWTAPELAVSGYRVYRATDHETTLTPVASTTGVSYIDSGLESRQQYYYRITSVY